MTFLYLSISQRTTGNQSLGDWSSSTLSTNVFWDFFFKKEKEKKGDKDQVFHQNKNKTWKSD
jgi:hypothetical protein